MAVFDINGARLIYDYNVSDIRLSSETLYSQNITSQYIQCSFVTESGKVWMITANDTCFVVTNGVLTKTITLDHAVGHANSCNYLDGNVYVSDWTDQTIIHVFSVDDANSNLTWTKDITVPTTYGRAEFFVFDDEKQIYSLSWNVNAYTDSQYMVVALWKLDKTGVYVNAFEFTVGGVDVCQGMTVAGGMMYILSNKVNSGTTVHGGIVIVDLATCEEYLDDSQTGTILTMETEGITALTDSTFLVTGMHGAQFLLTGTVI